MLQLLRMLMLHACCTKNLAKVGPGTYVDSPVNHESLAMLLNQEPPSSYLCYLLLPTINLRSYSFLVTAIYESLFHQNT